MRGKNIMALALFFVLIIFISIFILSLFGIVWINTYENINEGKEVLKIQIDPIITNIDGSTNFKASLNDSRELTEYYFNGDSLIVVSDYINWKSFFKFFGLEESYKITNIYSTYSDYTKNIKYQDKTNYDLNGGTDEFLKFIASDNTIASILADKIEKKQIVLKADSNINNYIINFQNSQLNFSK